MVRRKHQLACLMLAALPTLAWAEGAHNFGPFFAAIGFALVTALILTGHIVHTLSLRRATWGVRSLCLLAVAGIDLVIAGCIFAAVTRDLLVLDSALPFALAALPGFGLTYCVQRRLDAA